MHNAYIRWCEVEIGDGGILRVIYQYRWSYDTGMHAG